MQRRWCALPPPPVTSARATSELAHERGGPTQSTPLVLMYEGGQPSFVFFARASSGARALRLASVRKVQSVQRRARVVSFVLQAEKAAAASVSDTIGELVTDAMRGEWRALPVPPKVKGKPTPEVSGYERQSLSVSLLQHSWRDIDSISHFASPMRR